MTATMTETPTPVAVGPQVELRTPAHLRATGLLPVMCTVTGEPIRSCQVTATAVVDGHPVTVGRGHTSLEGHPSAHKVAVGVEMTDLGRSLAARAGGVSVVLDAVVQAGVGSSYVVSEPHQVALQS